MRSPKTLDVKIDRLESEAEYLTLTHVDYWIEIEKPGLSFCSATWTPRLGLSGFWASYDVRACNQLAQACAKFWAKHAKAAR